MGARGRKSNSESTKTALMLVPDFARKVEPPDGLTGDERAIWRETVASEPTDYFNTAALRALLKDYCRHRATSESVSNVINTFQAEWLKTAEGARRYRELTKIRDGETRAAAGMATKLRLTNQSRYTPQGAAGAARRAAKEKLPWEYDGND